MHEMHSSAGGLLTMLAKGYALVAVSSHDTSLELRHRKGPRGRETARASSERPMDGLGAPGVIVARLDPPLVGCVGMEPIDSDLRAIHCPPRCPVGFIIHHVL